MVDFLTADVLPDSRSDARRGAIIGPGGFWIPIYCASCGSEGGKVPEKNMTFVCWLCDDCFKVYGELTNLHVMPDEKFWEMVKQEQLEEYGRLLTMDELQQVLFEDASPLAKLIKQGSVSGG